MCMAKAKTFYETKLKHRKCQWMAKRLMIQILNVFIHSFLCFSLFIHFLFDSFSSFQSNFVVHIDCMNVERRFCLLSEAKQYLFFCAFPSSAPIFSQTHYTYKIIRVILFDILRSSSRRRKKIIFVSPQKWIIYKKKKKTNYKNEKTLHCTIDGVWSRLACLIDIFHTTNINIRTYEQMDSSIMSATEFFIIQSQFFAVQWTAINT